MKKMFLIAFMSIVSFVNVNAQELNDEDVNTPPENVIEVKYEEIIKNANRPPIYIHLEQDRDFLCFFKGKTCIIDIRILTLYEESKSDNVKMSITWEPLNGQDFKMPNGKFFNKSMTKLDYHIFIPKQTMIYDEKTNSFFVEGVKFFKDKE